MSQASIINTMKVLTQTMISVSQNITQGAQAAQVVNLICNSPEQISTCASCRQGLRDLHYDLAFVEKTCDFVCRCQASDIKLDQTISWNFNALISADINAKFVSSFFDNLILEAKLTKDTLFELPSRRTVIEKSVMEVLNVLRSTTVQTSLQTLKSQQVVRIVGASTTSGISMTQSVNMVSSVLMTSTEMTEVLNTLQVQMNALLVQELSGFAALLKWLIPIIFIGLALICGGVIINLFFIILAKAA